MRRVSCPKGSNPWAIGAPGAAARLSLTVTIVLSVLFYATPAGARGPAAAQAPVTSMGVAGTIGQGGWYRSPVLVVLTASPSGSGVRYRVDGGAVARYIGPFTVRGDGFHQVLYQARSSGEATGWLILNLALDTRPPTTSPTVLGGAPDAAGWYSHAVTVRLRAADRISGVGATYWRPDSAGPFRHYDGPFTVSAPGNTVLTYYSVDHAGNVEAAHVMTVRIDRQAPVTAAAINGAPLRRGVYMRRAVVRLRAVDDLAGVAAIVVGVDGARPVIYTRPIALTTTGPHIITYYALDRAGNVETFHRILVPLVASKPAAPRASAHPPRVRISASSSSVAWDHAVRLSVRVGPAARGAYVALLRMVSARGHTWKVLRYGRLDASGRANWVLRPQQSARYEAFAGAHSVSAEVAVRVSSMITLRRVRADLAGQVLLSGRAWPPVAGHRVALQQPQSGGRWHTVAITIEQPRGVFAFIVPYRSRKPSQWRVWDLPANGVTGGRSDVVSLAPATRH
jgi:hypothetical protein